MYKCDLLIQYCLKKGGEWAAANRINALRDCSDISQLCSSLASRYSPDEDKLLKRSCDLCVDACTEVQATMSKLSPDQYMKHDLKDVSQCKAICKEWWDQSRRHPAIAK